MSDHEHGATFKQRTILEVMKTAFHDKEKTKVNAEALALSVEILRVFALEAASRCVHQAQLQKQDTVELEHLEKILPQLLLDF